MLGLFKRLEVPRTNVATSNPIVFEKGQAELEFWSDSTDYIGTQTIPVENKWSDGTDSFMSPPAHYHLLQTETFHVVSGSGIWYLKGKEVKLRAGEDITIPRCCWHTFKNLPGSKEPLVFSYRYDKQRFIMEESKQVLP
jgi:mannose-6-phosphate isomerase-like protein (cupin superfamily)